MPRATSGSLDLAASTTGLERGQSVKPAMVGARAYAVGAGWYRDLRTHDLATLGCYLSPPNKPAQTSRQLKYVSMKTSSHRQAGALEEQETNEKDRVSGSARPGYLTNRNRALLERRLQGPSLGSDGDSASHGQYRILWRTPACPQLHSRA